MRLKITEGRMTTHLVWDGTQLLQERDGSGVETVRYLLQNGAYDGLRMQRKVSDGILRMLAYDVQGSNRALLNPDGTLDGAAMFWAFGEQIAQSGVSSRFG
jgi:hypothetical protein